MEEESHKALSADDIRHGEIVFHASVEEKSEIKPLSQVSPTVLPDSVSIPGIFKLLSDLYL